MFVVNNDMSIYATRGDIVFFDVSANYNGTPYTFEEGSVLRMRVFEKKACSRVVMLKDFLIEEDTQTVNIHLTGEDTKFGGVISKPTDYWYEIELNPETNPQTIVGYDEDGAKIFKLFPEGKDITDGDLDYENEVLQGQLIVEIEKAVEKIYGTTVISEAVNNFLEKNPIEKGADGKDGTTPHIGGNGNWWVGLNDTGVHAQGETGATGATGATGKDGVTPKFSIDKNSNNWVVSYDEGRTWVDTETRALANDGKDGKDGYTPVRGVDYFTEEDKKAVAKEVFEMGAKLTVTINRTTRTASHSASEIKEHLDIGYEVVLYDEEDVHLHSVDASMVTFSRIVFNQKVIAEHFYRVNDDKSFTEETVNHLTTTALDFSNWQSGSFKETLSDGSVATHNVVFDAYGTVMSVGGVVVSGVF